MTFLLDVNVLIALVDPAHISHELAHAWFQAEGQESWATYAITENGFIRITSHPKYPNAWSSPAEAIKTVARLRSLAGHQFWENDISLTSQALIDPTRLISHAHVTDTYLLALAASRSAKLATLDRKLSVSTVNAGPQTLCVIT